LAEDPYREPFEKELAVHLEGDGTHFSITSFKKVVYSKLLKHSEFNVKRFHILNDGHEQSVSSLDEVSDSTIIGVTGQLPVGTMSIGTPRNSNSHANIVKWLC
jgi:hypothetical protein